MHEVPRERWKTALAAYAAGGAFFGMAWLEGAAGWLGLRPGMGTMVAINLVLPLWTALVALWYPSRRLAAAGGLVVAAGWAIARLLVHNVHFWRWDLPLLGRVAQPILVAAALGYALIGASVATLVRPRRQVRRPPHAERCRACGYEITALEGGRCPECGRALAVADGAHEKARAEEPGLG